MEVLYPPPVFSHPHQTPYQFSRPPVLLHPPPTPYFPCPPPVLLHPPPTPYHYNFPSSPLSLPPPPPTRVIRWTPPPRGCLKLNTGGSCVNGRGSFGGVLRNEFGVWLSGYMGRTAGSNTTSLVAEILGVYKGLLVIHSLGLRNVVVETDCASVVDLFTTSNVNENHPHTTSNVNENHPHKGMIEHGRAIMSQWGCMIMHTYREGNMCADQIAKLGGKQAGELCFLDSAPACAIPFLLADANGVGFERPAKRHKYNR